MTEADLRIHFEARLSGFGLRPGAVKAMVHAARPSSFRRGEFLHRSGQVAKELIFVPDGHLKAHVNYEGREVVIGFIYGGDIAAGALDSFFDGTPSVHELSAITDGALLSLSRDQFFEWMAQEEPLARLYRVLLEQALAGRVRREVELLTHSAQERYERFCRDSGHLFAHVPLKDIASYLGMSAETLSRLRAQRD